jgi:Holliday junction resolvase RusA-like endonuclease
VTTLCFTIPGAPRTKKNHGRLDLRGRKPRALPSKAFEEWNCAAQMWIAKARTRRIDPIETHIDWPVNCRALFYRDAHRGDAVGYYQALADALEEGYIVKDDKFIVSWDGSRLLKDAKNPRIEVTLEW